MDGMVNGGLLLFAPVAPLLAATGPINLPPPPAAVFIITSTMLAALFIVVFVSSRLRRRLHKGPHGRIASTGLTRLEETGIIDIMALYALSVFLIYDLFVESALSAFAFGIGTVYFLDNALSFVHKEKIKHVRSEGVRRYLEEYGILEAALLIAAVYMLSVGAYAYGILLSWAFGMAFAAMVDRIRVRREIRA